MPFDFNRWIRQPSTLHGLGVVAAGVGMVLTHVTTGSPVWDGVVGAAAYAGVHLGIDDNSALEKDVESVAGDAAALAQGNPPTQEMIADAVKTLQAAADALGAPAPKGAASGATAGA